MHTGCAEVVDHTSRTANAGPDAGVLKNRQVVTGTGFRLDEVVVPTDILLREGGIETFSRLLRIVETVVGQRVANPGLVQRLAISDQKRIGRIVIDDVLLLEAGEEAGRDVRGDRYTETELTADGVR